MKKRIVLLIVLMVLALFSGTVMASCDSGVSEECPVIFFEHNLEGERLEITSPDYFEIPRLQERVLSTIPLTTWNDQISSIAIAEGFRVTVFENENYNGFYKSFTSQDDTSALTIFRDNNLIDGDPRGTWNNAISSLKVISLSSLGGAAGETSCNNGIDDDGDALADCDDPECAGEIGPDDNKCCQTADDCILNGRGAICTAHQCQEDLCSDNVDNDGDRDIDCLDEDCAEDALCAEEATVYILEDTSPEEMIVGDISIEQICDDLVDNDDDSFTDCQDSDCDGEAGTAGTCEYQTELTCNDSFDNDGDVCTRDAMPVAIIRFK